MTNVVKLIRPNLDEGADGNIKDLEMAIIRASIRKKIETVPGQVDRQKAKEIAARHIMCAETVIRFAYGETKKPSAWTIKRMCFEVGYQLVLVPLDSALPDGHLPLQ